jgi:hypothetical protein
MAAWPGTLVPSTRTAAAEQRKWRQALQVSSAQVVSSSSVVPMPVSSRSSVPAGTRGIVRRDARVRAPGRVARRGAAERAEQPHDTEDV